MAIHTLRPMVAAALLLALAAPQAAHAILDFVEAELNQASPAWPGPPRW